jgi:hypothetical protein
MIKEWEDIIRDTQLIDLVTTSGSASVPWFRPSCACSLAALYMRSTIRRRMGFLALRDGVLKSSRTAPTRTFP